MPRLFQTALGLSLGLLVAAQAQAGRTLTLTYSLGTSVTRDANLFRLAPGVDPLAAIGSTEKGDTLTTTSLGLVAEKELGIQHLKLDMQLGNTRFSQFRRLDNDHYKLSASWQWALARRLHGDLAFSRKTSLTGFDESPQTTRNINTTTTQSCSAYLQVGPDWELFGVLGQNNSANSAADRQAASYISRNTDTGLRHTTAGGHQLIVRKRQVRSALVRQDDVEASATWTYSPLAQLSGGLGHSRRHAEGGTAADSQGSTGRLRIDWTPSPKTRFNLATRQEIAAAASNFSTNTAIRGVSLGAGWMPTAKTSLQFSLDRSSNTYGNNPTATGTSREDRLRNAGLTLSYQPHHTLLLSLSLREEARDSNVAAFTYRDRLATATAQFAF